MDKIIDAKSIKLIKFFDIEDKSIYIPIFQRNYDWTQRECKRLFKDFEILLENPNYKHFLGNLFYSIDKETHNYLLIDGQQRLTSFTILIIALWKILSEDKNNNQEILKNDLQRIIFKEDSKDLKLKLKFSSKHQDELLTNLIIESDIHLRNKLNESDKINNIYKNFLYFYERLEIILKDYKKTYKEIFDAIKRFIIVSIEIIQIEDSNISIQRIFETLNSTGLPLKQSDLIRNFLLMNQTKEKQDKLYNNYWTQIEENTNSKIEEFFRYFLIYNASNQIDDYKIYEKFKEYYEKRKRQFPSITETFSLIKKYSEIYKLINEYSLFNGKLDLDLIIKNLINKNLLGYEILIPFLFYLYDKFENGNIDLLEIQDILKYTENFLFRRKIANYGTGRLRGFFNFMRGQLDRLKKDNPNYSYYDLYVYKVNEFMSIDDEKFINSFIDYKLYRNNGYFCKFYVLNKIEREISGDVNIDINSSTITVDHILPQKYYNNLEWKIEDKKEEIMNYIHTIGNLTLTANNPELSNKSYEKKLNIYLDTNKDNKISMIQDLVNNYQEWNLNNIKNRGKNLGIIANSIWFKIDSKEGIVDNKKTEEKDKIIINLFNYNDDPTDEKIKLLYNENPIYSEKTLNKQYCICIENILKMNENYIEKFIEDFENIISYNEYKNNCKEININGNILYINKNLSNKGILSNLKLIINELNLDRNLIKLEI